MLLLVFLFLLWLAYKFFASLVWPLIIIFIVFFLLQLVFSLVITILMVGAIVFIINLLPAIFGNQTLWQRLKR